MTAAWDHPSSWPALSHYAECPLWHLSDLDPALCICGEDDGPLHLAQAPQFQAQLQRTWGTDCDDFGEAS